MQARTPDAAHSAHDQRAGGGERRPRARPLLGAASQRRPDHAVLRSRQRRHRGLAENLPAAWTTSTGWWRAAVDRAVRPGRGRAGGAAGGRPGRPPAGVGHPHLRAERRGRPDRVEQGLGEGADARRLACRRPAPRSRRPSPRPVACSIGFSWPLVLKADGLAAGKGVTSVSDRSRGRGGAGGPVCAPVARRGGRRGAGRGVPGRPELSVAGALATASAGGDAARPRLQADLRRRPRPEHRRHGRLHPTRASPRPSLLADVEPSC